MKTTEEKIAKLRSAKEDGETISEEFVRELLDIKNEKLVEKYMNAVDPHPTIVNMDPPITLPPEPTDVDLKFYQLVLKKPNGSETKLKLVFQKGMTAILEEEVSV